MTDSPKAPPSCPRCPSPLVHVERRGMVVEVCPACQGIWLDPGELSVLLELYRRLETEGARATDARCVRCPEATLRELPFPGTDVQVDACPGCQGVWLDGGELELLRKHVERLVPPDGRDLTARARAILGEAERAQAERLACPRCAARLWHIRRQGNLIELCSGCGGLFFDGGELTVLLGVYRAVDAAAGAPSAIGCLRCGEEMRELPYPQTDVLIDICPACQAIFLDRGELEQLEAAHAGLVPGAAASFTERAREVLDTLDRGEVPRAACPGCGGRLEGQDGRDTERQVGGSPGGRVRAERCADCRGTWLDAGDLTRVVGVSRRIRPRDGHRTESPCVRCPGETLYALPYPQTDVPLAACPDCRGTWLAPGALETLAAALRPA